MTITKFLEARIAEDEAVIAEFYEAESNERYHPGHDPDLSEEFWMTVVDGNMDRPTIGIGVSRMESECAAKRRIVGVHWQTGVNEYQADDGSGYGDMASVCSSCGTDDEYGTEWPCPTIVALASIYHDHPDYDPEWSNKA